MHSASKNTCSCVTNNGYSSGFFTPSRGIRQGCPLSAYLFIIAVEILAIEIRQNNKIKGLDIGGVEVKIAQMADDTTIFTSDIDSLKHIFDTLDIYNKAAGLKLNRSKTEALKLGINTNNVKGGELGINWKTDMIFSLGIWHCLKSEDSEKMNFKERMQKFSNLLNMWNQRDLSIKGKITVIKNLALPQLLYVSSNLAVPEWFVKDITSIMYNFIWSGKRDKIKRNTIISKIEFGGLKMIDFENMIKSQKIMWIKRLISTKDATWKAFPQWLMSYYQLDDILKCNYSLEKMPFELPLFYHQIFYAWGEIRLLSESKDDVWNIRREPLWFNKNILIEHKYASYNYKLWYQSGIKIVHNLVDSRGNFHEVNILENKYGIKIDVMKYNSIKSAIPTTWKKLLKSITVVEKAISDEELPLLSINNVEIPISAIRNKDVYWMLTDEKSIEPISKKKWNESYDLCDDTWKKIYKLPFYNVRDSKLQTLQYKILNRIFPCNYYVSKFNKDVSELCETCNLVDTIEHYFVICDTVKPFWTSFSNWWKTIGNEYVVLNSSDIIFGYFGECEHRYALNYCILYAKKFISHQKYINKDVFFLSYLLQLKNSLEIEHFICSRNNKLVTFIINFSVLYDAL